MDEWIFTEVFDNNEYDLPETFCPDDVILDIGGHIGSFAAACLERGAGKVHVFEPEPDNYRLAVQNLAQYGNRAVVYPYGVWKSLDMGIGMLGHSGYNGENTGAGSVVFGGENPVPVVGLDLILYALKCDIRLVKLDCEYAEFPVLFSSQLFPSRVAEIVGEFHEMGGDHDDFAVPEEVRVPGIEPPYTGDVLMKHLEIKSYRTWYRRIEGTNQGIFRAVRVDEEITS